MLSERLPSIDISVPKWIPHITTEVSEASQVEIDATVDRPTVLNLIQTQKPINNAQDLIVRQDLQDLLDELAMIKFLHSHNNTPIAYGELPGHFKNRAIPYGALLKTIEWHNRRNQILERDLNVCQNDNCKRRDTSNLQVHHCYYVVSKLPWEYPDEAFLTLCRECHFDLHRTQRVPFFEDENRTRISKEVCPCPRCNGIGWIPCWRHIEDGICFSCWGKGFGTHKAISSIDQQESTEIFQNNEEKM